MEIRSGRSLVAIISASLVAASVAGCSMDMVTPKFSFSASSRGEDVTPFQLAGPQPDTSEYQLMTTSSARAL